METRACLHCLLVLFILQNCSGDRLPIRLSSHFYCSWFYFTPCHARDLALLIDKKLQKQNFNENCSFVLLQISLLGMA